MREATFLSVIIPTYHRNDLLALCLDKLAPTVQSLSSNSYEIIVTDDGVNETAQAMLNELYPWAKWVAGPQKGPAANRNNGAKHAQGNWLVFLDDDCLPDVDCLNEYKKQIEADNEIKAIEGRIYVTEPRTRLDQVSPINEIGGYFWSCNIAIEQILFYKIGKFDERFPYAAMEDVDLRIKIYNSGKKNIFLRSASVEHPWRKHGGWNKFMQSEKSILIYLTIHPQEKKVINSYFFLKKVVRSFLYYTVPFCFEFRFKGAAIPFLEHFAELRLMVLLLVK